MQYCNIRLPLLLNNVYFLRRFILMSQKIRKFAAKLLSSHVRHGHKK